MAGVVGAAWSVVVRCSRRESTLYRSISPPTNITTSSPLLQQNSHSFKRGGGGGRSNKNTKIARAIRVKISKDLNSRVIRSQAPDFSINA